jgi:hypothetical protein
VVLNPVPSIVTVAPTIAAEVVSATITGVDELWRAIESRLPTAS